MHKEYVGRKVHNVTGVNLRQNFASACAPSFFLKVITWFEPAIQRKNSTWSAVNLKEMQPQWAITLSTCYGHVILVSGYLVLTNEFEKRRFRLRRNNSAEFEIKTEYLCRIICWNKLFSILLLFYISLSSNRRLTIRDAFSQFVRTDTKTLARGWRL